MVVSAAELVLGSCGLEQKGAFGHDLVAGLEPGQRDCGGGEQRDDSPNPTGRSFRHLTDSLP